MQEPSSTPPPKVTRARPARRRFISQIPSSIADDPHLKEALTALPANYNFEVPKTIWRLKQMNAKSVALQMPEGLLLYACTIADIIERFAGCETVIMGDVTYGACCVDDLSAAALGCELLVHYGHSCLVPIDRMATDVLYVFVEIAIDVGHLVDTVQLNFTDSSSRIALCGTVQFTGAMHAARAALAPSYADVSLPQCKPLSAGEVLGCTSPALQGRYDLCVFVADGRFHPEAVMIANPQVKACFSPRLRLSALLAVSQLLLSHSYTTHITPLTPASFLPRIHTGAALPLRSLLEGDHTREVRAQPHALAPPKRDRPRKRRHEMGSSPRHVGPPGQS